jgi:DNA repair ATPase RecN
MKYAKVVQNERGEDVLRIHWDQINLVEDPEQGQRIEDYVSQLEEWFDSLEEAEDKLNDIEDRIEEVKELGKEEYLDLENAVKDALTASY